MEEVVVEVVVGIILLAFFGGEEETEDLFLGDGSMASTDVLHL